MFTKISIAALAFCLAALVLTPVHGQSDADKDQAAILAEIDKPRGPNGDRDFVLSIPGLRLRLEKQMNRQRFDGALKALADKDVVTLHECDQVCHDKSSEREKSAMLIIDGTYFYTVQRKSK